MAARITIKGAEQFAKLSKTLRTAPKEIRREAYRSLNSVTAPLKKDAKVSALVTLPSRGGLAKRVAGSKFTTKRRGGAHASVSIVAKSGIDIRSMDKGNLRHPVFGNMRNWVAQRVPAGWFTKPMKKGAPKVRRELVKAMRRIAIKIARAA